MDFSTQLQIILGLLTILLIVALVFSWKNWRVHTVALVALNFMAAIAFGYMATRTLRTHRDWRNSLRDDYVKKIDATKKEIDQLVHGKMDEDKHVAGIEELQKTIDLDLWRCGRAWHECKAEPGPAGSRTLKVSLPAAGQGVQPKTIMYVFNDLPIENGGDYVGEFRVVSVTGKSLDLELAHSPLLRDPRKLQGVTTVSVYEVMPEDNHAWFSSPVFAKGREALLNSIADLREREVVQKQFEHDGQEATDTDPPETVMIPVKFTKEYKAAAAQTDPNNTKEPKFAAGEIAWLPKLSHGGVLGADDLIKEGTAEPAPDLKPRYQRPLRNYAARFEESRRQMIEDYAVSEQTKRQIESVTADIATVNQTIVAAKDENAKLKSDLAQLKLEQAAVEDQQQKLSKVHAEMLATRRNLFVGNVEMEKEIFALQWRAVEELNRRAKANSQATATRQ